MQDIDREPLFCTEFAEQKVCPVLDFFVFQRLLRRNINQTRGNIHKILQILLFLSSNVHLVIK